MLRTISLVVTDLWDPGTQAPLATRARQSRVSITKTRAPDVTSRHRTWKSSPAEILALWSVAEGQCEDGALPPRSQERLIISS